MEVVEMLDNLKEKARRDPALREMLLATRREKEPLAAFCKKCRELGVPVYEMDLIAAGEEFYAAMKRSTNGGGENSPMLEGEDDFYELFFAVMNCFLLGWSEKIVSKFRINILLQHRELYTTDLQYLAVESFQIKVLAKAVLFGSA